MPGSGSSPFDFRDQSFAHRAEALGDGLAQGAGRPTVPRLDFAGASLPRRTAEPPIDDDPGATRTTVVEVGGVRFQISGNVVSCACPECTAPMSVRIWLGLADCWRCRCGMELDREQVETLTRALDRIAPRAEEGLSTRRPDWTGLTSAARNPEGDFVSRIADDPADLANDRWFLGWLPAWLVSFLIHVLLIVILALIAFAPDPNRLRLNPLELILSTFVNDQHREEGEVRVQPDEATLNDDLIPAADLERASVEERAVLADAAELRVDPQPLADLPDLESVRRNVTVEPGERASLAVRDPRLREEIVVKEGGTTQTEAAVARGLRWLASVQNSDGSWSLEDYDAHANPRNEGDAAATGLALLPFLGAGQTHEYGIYKETVSRGLAWLIENQARDGDLRVNFPGQAGMYAHGQCAIVLCEAYALTGDERLRDPAQRAIDFIEEAQHSRGGWRYQPGQAGDTSVFGWQLMALQSARETGSLRVDGNVLRRAGEYLNAAGAALTRDPIREAGVLYRYQPRESAPTASMTAEAMLCRMYLGWQSDDPRVMRCVRWLASNHLPEEGDECDIYYWYYATQVLHHFGGREWERWNAALRDRLVDMQQKRGRHAGSFEPSDFLRGDQGERIFTTSFAVCILEVYYRRLPLFRRIELDRP
jgi:Squalene-hopene cyclase C-terminal domain